MIPKINGLGRSFAGVAAYCLARCPGAGQPPSKDLEAGRVDLHPEPCDGPAGAGRAADGRHREDGPRPQAVGGRRARRAEAGEAGPAHSLSWARDETSTAGDEPGGGTGVWRRWGWRAARR